VGVQKKNFNIKAAVYFVSQTKLLGYHILTH